MRKPTHLRLKKQRKKFFSITLATVKCGYDKDTYVETLTAILLTTLKRQQEKQEITLNEYCSNIHFHSKTSLLRTWRHIAADYRCRADRCEVAFVAQEIGFAPVWQMSAHPTLFASPVMLPAISSSNLPSFTWMSQVIVKKPRQFPMFDKREFSEQLRVLWSDLW